MTKQQVYSEQLSTLKKWEPYLLAESCLPGPRANLELLAVVGEKGTLAQFDRWSSMDETNAPANTPREFLVACGVVGLGRLVSEGKTKHLARLRALASDPRWRVREAVVIGLQRWGDTNLPGLLKELVKWSDGNWTEKRAAAAALCEPRLLSDRKHVRRVLGLLDKITGDVHKAKDRKSEGLKVLRKGLGYCWSVAAAADMNEGKERMEFWVDCNDSDIRWIMKENLTKNSLLRLDPGWVRKCKERLE